MVSVFISERIVWVNESTTIQNYNGWGVIDEDGSSIVINNLTIQNNGGLKTTQNWGSVQGQP